MRLDARRLLLLASVCVLPALAPAADPGVLKARVSVDVGYDPFAAYKDRVKELEDSNSKLDDDARNEAKGKVEAAKAAMDKLIEVGEQYLAAGDELKKTQTREENDKATVKLQEASQKAHDAKEKFKKAVDEAQSAIDRARTRSAVDKARAAREKAMREGDMSRLPDPTPRPQLTPDPAKALMDMAGQLDKGVDNAQAATGEFLGGAADSIKQTLEYFAQPRGDFGRPGKPLQDIIDYLNNDYNENDKRLYDAAVQALDEFQKNPARFLGEQAPNLLPTHELGDISRARQAAQRLSEVQGAARKFSQFEGEAAAAAKMKRTASEAGYGSQPKKPADSAVTKPPQSSRPPVNPFLDFENCVEVSIAQDQTWATGKPSIALDTRPGPNGELVKGTMQSPEVQQTLRRKYGKTNPKDPLHGPGGLIAARQGIPVPSSKSSIEWAMNKAGQDSRGLAFIERADGSKHVFNVRNSGGKIQFWDAQVDQPASWADVTKTFFYRTN